jgi:zinc protease
MVEISRRAVLTIPLVAAAATPAAAATRIERVRSPGGIEAWLVQDRSNPLIAMDFALRGGNAQDADGKGGSAAMVTALLAEGAGPLDSRAFQERKQRLAADFGFGQSRDWISGSLRTLTVNRDASFEMLRLAMSAPRFDSADVERVRVASLTGLRREQGQPNAIAARVFQEVAFPGHPYGRPGRGSIESVTALTIDDLRDYHARVFAREHLMIGVVGDIDAATLGPLLDATFGHLPARARLAEVPAIAPRGLGTRRIVSFDNPQTVMQFMLPGPLRSDPDFIPAFVMNHVLGGGSFTSRLWREVRETRGLTYSIGTGLSPLARAAVLGGSTSTRNDRVSETLTIIERVIREMAETGPSQEELTKAKQFLIGSFLLRFDNSARIAGQLVAFQQDGLGPEWLERRNQVIDAVTIEDTRRAARRFLLSEMIVTLVGRPTGVTERSVG